MDQAARDLKAKANERTINLNKILNVIVEHDDDPDMRDFAREILKRV